LWIDLQNVGAHEINISQIISAFPTSSNLQLVSLLACKKSGFAL
jgi:hypothetical protein